MAAEGQTDKEIAGNLGLSLKTIHTYWDRMRLKFQSSTRTQVFAKFLRIELSPASRAARLSQLFSTWPEGVWAICSPDETLYANSKMAEMFGIAVELFHSLTPQQVFRQIQATELMRLFDPAVAPPEEMTISIRRSGNERAWIKVVITALTDTRSAESALLLRFSDIGDLKDLERAVRAYENVLRNFLDLATDGICRFDEDYVCRYVNPSLAKRLKPFRKNFVGRRIEEFEEAFGSADGWKETINRALRTGKQQSFRLESTPFQSAEITVAPEHELDSKPRTVLAMIRSPRD